MQEWLIYAIGFAAQILFSARLIIQWISTEKNNKVTTPKAFWIHSLIASFLLFIYGYLRHDFAIMLGQSITYYIYIRNLHFIGAWKRLNILLRMFILLFPLILVLYFYNNNAADLTKLFSSATIRSWVLLLGTGGQLIFTFRFILQWIYSERRKESVMPMRFWVVSIIGSGMILGYGIIRKDPVLIVGQLFGFVVYLRNIMILRKQIET